MNRLIQIDNDDCSGIKYTYDPNGNRTSRYEYNIISKDSVLNETCPHANDGAITLTATGDFSYKWSNGQTTSTVKNLAPGNYSVIITDKPTSATCSKSFTILPQFVDSFSVQTQNPTCFQSKDGSAKTNAIIADTRSTYTYNWSNTADTSYNSLNSVSNLQAARYAVHIRNSYTGCIKTIPFTIIQPPAIITGINKHDNICFGANKGDAIVNVLQAASQYSYSWTGNTFSQPQTSQKIDSLADGDYFVKVRENFGNHCMLSDTAVINGPTQANLLFISTDSSSTLTSADGSATAHVVGDTLGYNYQCFDKTRNTFINQNNATIIGLKPGKYILTITSLNTDSCKSTKAFTITAKNTTTQYVLVPNPTNGFVYVTVYDQIPADVTYTVFSSSGQMLISNTINATSGQVIQLNLSSYADGIYFIQLVSAGQKVTLRVVKQ